ncbi:MAG: choice-of-anchor Q domain-containing protein, partial [Planctomycetota bacterium]
VFWNVPDPYVSGGWPNAQVPANDRMWDPVDLGNAQLLARTDDKRGVVTLYQASSYNAIFVSEMIEYQGNSVDTQFLYNALTIGQISEPATIYVDVDVPAGGDGSGWADAFNDLQGALAFAKSGDEIRVAQGAYTPEGPLLDIHLATNPNPANGARRVTITAELSWTAGADATSHDVYFGTTSPGMFQGNQSGTTFDPGTMAYSTTYYWRIDELNQGGTTTGTVWSFRTMGPGPSLSPPEGDSNEQAALEVIDREATFQLKNGVVIKGGYAGFGEPNADARDIEAYETILSGDLLGNDEPNFVNYEENSYHVVTGSGTDETAVLDGVTITAGNANGYFAGPTARGGGMYNEYGNPTILNCTFTRNSAGQSGGGICNHISSSPNLTNCTFSRNSTDVYGGGMSNRISSSPALTNCTFSSNSADICGGGMNNYDQSSPTLTNCTFSGNSASRDGGGMYNRDSSSPALTNCKFTGNSAILYGGGGMRNIESNPTLTNCTFNNNSANRGGGISNWLGSPIVSDCTFSSNSAELGGAVLNWQCSPMLANCTFSNNSAGIGGAIYQFNSISTLINCILWGNTAPSGSQIHNDGTSSTEVTYSDVQGGWPGQGNIDADPCFVQLGYWVQPPPGHPGDDIWVEGDYHLLHGSPCINTGDPDYIAEPDETDLDGKPRVIGGRIDMGAYEFNHIDGSGSSDDDSTPGTIDDINDFNWYELDPCDPNVDVFLGSGQIIDCNLSIGEHIFVLEVIDKVGASDTNEVTIIVQDTTPPTITCPSSERIVAYNDCVYRYGIGSGFAGSTSGPLVDQVTGDDMDIMITLTESGGVNWEPGPANGGSDCAIGTDAYNTFGGTADMTGVIYHGSTGWWVDLTFTGLDPTTEYTFATSAARNNYSGRLTIYTLTGADTYTNASTSGVDVLAENKVRFNTGDNHYEGYVARWTGITATDGSFTVRAEADPSSTDGRKAYSFDVFMLEGVLPGDVTLECPADT